MKKITFKNGQAPALSDTNLNQLQTNVEEAINERVSKTGSNTINGTVTINNPDSFENLKGIRTIDGTTYNYKVGIFNSPYGGAANLQLVDPVQSKTIAGIYAAKDGNLYNQMNGFKIVDESYDTGWKDISLATGITVGSVIKKAQYRRVGKTVYLQGDVAGITNGSTLIGTLPVGFRPSAQTYLINATSGMRYTRIFISTNGEIKLEWVSDGTYDLGWYEINCSFLVN